MIEVSNLTKQKITLSRFVKIGEKVLAAQKRENFWFSVSFVSLKKIQGLNKKHRGKDKPTDVLSFEIFGKEKFSDDFKFLGDIIICPDQVLINAKQKSVKFEQELDLVYIHGILHLLGYDHEGDDVDAQKMERLQQKYLKNFNSPQ